jgi:peptide/nickel transport system substrate-binding protein
MKKLLPVLLILAAVVIGSCKQKSPAAPQTENSSCPSKPEFPGAVDKILPDPEQKPTPGDWLVRRMPSEPATLNPVTATDIYAEYIDSLVLEPMLYLNPATQDFEPLLAERYEISPDKLDLTFYLRKDVRWHDGKPLTADDVIFTFQKIMDPKVDSAALRVYFIDCTKAEKIDEHTVRFHWKQPYFKALETVGQTMFIIPKHLFDDSTDFNKHPFARKPVGTGPYRLTSWETGKKIELVRNEQYWGKKPYFQRIIFKVITDDNVALQVFNQGELDVVGLTPTQWLKQTNYPEFLKKNHKLYYDYPAFGYIGWNMRRTPFDDRRVRTAMTLLLNRQAILKNIFSCLGQVVSGPNYINTPYYDPSVKPLPYDPEQAKKILDEAGWSDHNGDGIRDKDGKDFKFEFLLPAGSADTEKIATIYKEDLARVGITMEIRKLEWAVFLQNIQEFSFDACTLGWVLDAFPDLYQIWHSSMADVKGSSNHVGYKNPEVDRLIEQARQEFDKQKRIELNRQIHRIIAQDQPYTFLFTFKELAALDKRLTNVVPYPIRPIFLYTEWFVPAGMQKYAEGMKPAP